MFKIFNILWLIENCFTLYGGGKDGGDAPDYTALAAASAKAAELGKELGDAQLAESKRQYDSNMAVARPVIQSQAALSNQQIAQGNDYFNYGKQYSRPVEQQLYYESMGFTPEEVAQIEASRSREISAFNASSTAPVPVTFTVPTSTVQQDIPAGAVKGSEIGSITVTEQNPLPRVPGYDALYKPFITKTIKADPNAYYIKNPSGGYQQVAVGTKTVEGTKSVTQDAPQDASRLIQQTPETDTLTAQIGMAATARQKAADAAARGEITTLNTNLANRIGESDVETYLRNKAAIDAETDQAVADARSGYTNASNNLIRQGLRYGMSPAKIAAAAATNNTTQASKQAAAANSTRKAATQTMYQRGVGQSGQLLTGGIQDRNNKIQDESIQTAKKLDVAGLYRGMPGASQGAYGLGISAGNSAVNNQMQPSNQLLNANQAAHGTIMQGSQQNISGLSNIVSSQTSLANQNDDSGIWGALGTVGGAAISQWSDKNVKKDVKKVSDVASLEGVKKTNIKSWKYDDKKVEGQDDKEHVGAMAQDLKKNLGDKVSDGKMVDMISAVGVTMSAVKALAKEVDKLKGKK